MTAWIASLPRRALLASLAAGAWACGGDAGTGLGGDLTEAEAAQLLTALSAVYLPSPSAPAPGAPAPVPALETTTTLVADTTEFSVACPAGGSAVVMNGDSISITVDVRLNPTPDTTFVTNSTYGGRSRAAVRYSNCSATDGFGGIWSFDSDPGLVLDFELEGTLHSHRLASGDAWSSSTGSWNGLWSGTLGWSNGDRSGSCLISVEMISTTSVAGGQGSATFSQNGQICGLVVSTSS